MNVCLKSRAVHSRAVCADWPQLHLLTQCRVWHLVTLGGSSPALLAVIGQKRALTSSLLMMELACILKPDQSRSRAPTPALFRQPLLAPGLPGAMPHATGRPERSSRSATALDQHLVCPTSRHNYNCGTVLRCCIKGAWSAHSN